MHLRPAPKVIRQLRALYPNARITGWKYELEGTNEDALARARLQLETCQTDACVLNGAAFGDGFAYLTANSQRDFPDKAALAKFLTDGVS